MIFEVRTYLLKPGTVPQAEQAFADKIAERVKLLAAGAASGAPRSAR